MEILSDGSVDHIIIRTLQLSLFGPYISQTAGDAGFAGSHFELDVT